MRASVFKINMYKVPGGISALASIDGLYNSLPMETSVRFWDWVPLCGRGQVGGLRLYLSAMAAKLRGFWLRISDGVAIHQLWEQFRADARTSYHLYSKELESKAIEGESRRRRGWRVARELFWAVMTKLSPARRVL